MSRAYIGLGSNLGDRAALLASALVRLRSLGTVIAASALYETAPWGKVDQPHFLNAACVLETGLEPRALLAELGRIERELGRDRAREERWGPRAIDLDLLLYDERVVREGGLALPHPGLHERPFALVPLAEIAPEARHPLLQRQVGELAREVGGAGVRRLDQRLGALPPR